MHHERPEWWKASDWVLSRHLDLNNLVNMCVEKFGEHCLVDLGNGLPLSELLSRPKVFSDRWNRQSVSLLF